MPGHDCDVVYAQPTSQQVHHRLISFAALSGRVDTQFETISQLTDDFRTASPGHDFDLEFDALFERADE